MRASMNRNGGVVALTVVGVLMAGAAAAALNTVVLHSGTQASVGSAERFLASGRASFDPNGGSTQPATAAPVVNEDGVLVSDGPAASAPQASSAAAASAPRVSSTSTRRATVSRVSPTRASASPTDDHSGSADSPSTAPTSGSESGGGGSDD